MSVLYTPRLKLKALTKAQLGQYLHSPQELEAELGIPISVAILTEVVQRAIQLKIAKMDQAPVLEHDWYTYWLIIPNEAAYGAGLAGFKGLQDGKKEVEIGYGIDPAYQGRGYMTETVQALIGWAFQDSDCRAVVARNVLKTNLASIRVLEKVGMRPYLETRDTYAFRVRKRDFSASFNKYPCFS
jgi:GNAT superfamily N-acetyltransferase